MTQTFVNIFDRSRKKTAVLQNAYSIKEAQELNKIYNFSFCLPSEDEKAEFCQPFHFVRYGEGKQLYRIAKQARQDADTGQITYDCEHAVTTLCDTLLFGSYISSDYATSTRDVINWLLDQQPVKNWILGECDFDFDYEYCWEQENLLNALYSVPKPFVSPYKWTFDCSSWPWKINLKRIDETAIPEYYIRAKRNLLASGVSSDSTEICTRIWPLGYGEGVNQLTIKEVNGGVPYLQAPQAVIDQYGIIDRVLVDRSFESAESLKAYAQTMLDGLSAPTYERSFDVVDLYPITSGDIDNAEVGKICRMAEDNTTAYITKTERILDEPGNLQISLSNKTTNVADTIADLADRVRIETVYAQGATQLYQHSKDANATSSKGSLLSLYFPKEMKQINKVLLKVELSRFRAYSQSTAAGGGSSTTSASGGGGSTTSASGGGTGTTSTGSASVSFSGSSGAVWSNDYNWVKAMGDSGIPQYTNNTTVSATGTSHSHKFNPTVYVYKGELAHTHNISFSSVGSHSHSFSVGSHTHSVSIPSHSHSVTIPEHSHSITPGIYEVGTASSSFGIYVNGTLKQTISSTRWEGDITEWLLTGSGGTIPRDSWIKVEIRPNAMAYVISSVFVQGFVQSRGGGNY